MIDPLAEVVTLLQPTARYTKVVNGAGRWGVRRTDVAQPFYCAVMEGCCRLTIDGFAPLLLRQGDFVLLPAASDFTMTSAELPSPAHFAIAPVTQPDGEIRSGEQHGPADVRLLIGHCVFASPDAGLLVSLLPQQIHVRGESRLATLVQLVGDEWRARRPAREVILARLLEVLLIEALRSSDGTAATPGLIAGLADERLAVALRQMHGDITRSWTMAELAKAAAMSRSAFFERFSRAMGVAPMAYLLAWRMARAKRLLLGEESVASVAEQTGYRSASAFSVAFSRYVGIAPTRFASLSQPQPEDTVFPQPDTI
ncbi:AraC family transcriptional regulator [Erwinia oleae]|uniref:AraC family transcriptional regulator n=1 Tax=Erwinia oleae TaxID=796334 RepID=UPI00068B81F0|nr:AraC family transcriptional regulator [Erwinia oleae]